MIAPQATTATGSSRDDEGDDARPWTCPRSSDASAGLERSTRALIDLDAYAENVRRVLDRLSSGTELMAVVKANGYGHGASMISRTALAAGASHLAVATVGEGAQLRQSGIAAPILVLGPIDGAEVMTALHLDLQSTVATDSLLDAVADAARALPLPRPAVVHVKVDTGMRRYGADLGAAVALARRVAADPALSLGGFSTHFAAADESDETFTREQAARFDHCLADLAAAGVRPARVHAANSGAILRSRRYDYDLVRVGIALYGLPPSPDVALLPGMRPVMSLHGRIARVIDLGAGDTVGYGRSYRVATPERAALVPIGYADGYRRALSGCGWMGFGGRRVPIRGRVSMDQTVVGLPPDLAASVGDEVAIFGGDPITGAPSIPELADLIGTILYEVVTSIAPRVPRHYLRGGDVVAIDAMAAS